MNLIESLGFKGTRVVITGAASGVGKAAAELIIGLGGHVVAIDVAPADIPGATFIRCNLAKKDSVDSALERIDDSVDALLNIAGVSSGGGFSNEDIVAINYLGHRRLTEGLLPRLAPNGAVVCVSSGAGMNYLQHLDTLRPFVELSDFDSAAHWLSDHADLNNGYQFSKEATCLWVKLCAVPYGERHGVRINAVAPGLVDTPMLGASKDGDREHLIQRSGGYLKRPSHPIEQAWPVVFLASQAASYVTGQILAVDGGITTTSLRSNTAVR